MKENTLSKRNETRLNKWNGMASFTTALRFDCRCSH